MHAEYDITLSHGVSDRLLQLAYETVVHPGSVNAKEFYAALSAFDVLREGRERYYDGERLGYSPSHYDLRDCAEIKVPVIQEYNRRGRPLGPSHRMIYREYDPPRAPDLPVREIVAFAPRADGQSFGTAGDELNRTRGAELETLEGFLNTKPALGPDKDPGRAVSPPRLRPTPDIAAAIATRISGSPCVPTWTAGSLSGRALAGRRLAQPKRFDTFRSGWPRS